jgi:hypothetical protein
MLWEETNDYYPTQIKIRNIECSNMFKKIPKFLKILRKIHIVIGGPGQSVWFGEWKRTLDNNAIYIVHSTVLTPAITNHLYYKGVKKVIVWYWNPVIKTIMPDKYKTPNLSIFTFDEFDSHKYNLKYNTQYYIMPNRYIENNEMEFDVFFIGRDKGRRAQLAVIEEQLSNNGLKTKFIIIDDKSSSLDSNYINYDRVIEYITRSKSILDYVSTKQTGLTIRPLESIFYRKKLITNDKTIIERDFYKQDNIFILDDNIDLIKKFLATDYVSIDSEIVEKYEFSNWLKRFTREED